ncbi:MAG: 4Fe-4S dicluster domain-containing protein [Deltaproteobacteria bacterium]|nr:4Fe-4S dicluster domain-containing protein [Deltaproteobacteria bacterium]
MSRRKFIGWFGAASGALLVSGKARASGKEFKGFPKSNGVLHDTALCVGCRTCESVCNKENKLGKPDKPFTDLTVLKEKRRTTNDAYTVVNKFETKKGVLFAKKQCNHCLEPACASVCFVKAFKKDKTGAVTYDADVCVGCRYCMVACPFDVPTYEYDDPFTPEVKKCTLCKPRIDAGKLPACVEGCPKDALIFGERKKLLKIARKRIEKHPERYEDHIYGEKEMGGTSWLYLSPAKFEEIDMREDLGSKSAPELTHGALAVVPMVVGLWPAFLTGMYAMTKRRQKIALDEKNEAVKVATETTKATADEALKEALKKAESAKEKAIDSAVKKALEEAKKSEDTEEEE